jgi:hypothetical protein
MSLCSIVGSSVEAKLLEDLGDVWGEDGLGDVVLVGDLLAGVPELGRGALGVGLLVDEPGDGLAEGVRGDPIRGWFRRGPGATGGERC